MPDVVVDIVMGIVQGLTEFLPVSSSGHLVVVPHVFGWDRPGISFDLLLHVGTLLAVVTYFRDDLRRIVLGVFARGEEDATGARRMALWLGAATVPAAVVGLTFEDTFEQLFEEPLWVCGFWLVTAAVLVGAERLSRRASTRTLDLRIALLVGVAQAAAIAPGISRAGATIAMGIVLGLPRVEAARFSFLLAIPAIAGGGVTLIPDILDGRFEITLPILAGFVAAVVSGYLAVAWLLRIIRTSSLRPFSLYLVVAAPVGALLVA